MSNQNESEPLHDEGCVLCGMPIDRHGYHDGQPHDCVARPR